MNNWNTCTDLNGYIPELKDFERCRFLVTVERGEKRFVWMITADGGKVVNPGSIPGTVIAWQPVPAPYAG